MKTIASLNVLQTPGTHGFFVSEIFQKLGTRETDSGGSLILESYILKQTWCLSVWTKIGQYLEDSSNHCPFLYINSLRLSVTGFWGVREGEAGEAASNHHGFRLCVRLSEPVHSDPLTIFARPILQPPDDKFTIARFFMHKIGWTVQDWLQ
jgi:hypothetical protein